MKFDIIDISAGATVIATVNSINEVVEYLYDKSQTTKTQYANPTDWYIAESYKSWLFMDPALK